MIDGIGFLLYRLVSIILEIIQPSKRLEIEPSPNTTKTKEPSAEAVELIECPNTFEILPKEPPKTEPVSRTQAWETMSQGQELVDVNLRLSSLSGLDAEVKFVRENILFPFVNKENLSENGAQLPKGIVFNGPSGVAQISVAKTIPAELSRLTGQKFSFFRRSNMDVFPEYLGKGVALVEALFKSALSKAPAVVLIDDMDTFIPFAFGQGKCDLYLALVYRCSYCNCRDSLVLFQFMYTQGHTALMRQVLSWKL